VGRFTSINSIPPAIVEFLLAVRHSLFSIRLIAEGAEVKSSLGWTLLSREALKRAEAQLESERGVRDEIGFLLLHQAYSDRFFPGTSVLHTRVRYAIFVPLIYRDAAAHSRKNNIETVITASERSLTWRLLQAKMGDGAGIIGARIYPKESVQSPSMIYWNALSTWRILYPDSNGSFPTRSAVNRICARQANGSALVDDDAAPLEEIRALFADVPEPREWKLKGEPLEFALSGAEKRFLVRQISSVCRPDGQSSLLARLVEGGFVSGERDLPWSRKIREYADREDRRALIRAGQASSMSAIGRAIYDALVEQQRAEDGLPPSSVCRNYLEQIKEYHRDKALKLEVDSLREDFPTMPTYLRELLLATHKWLSGTHSLSKLLPYYEEAEYSRKLGRARLSRRLSGKLRRAEWTPPVVAEKWDGKGPARGEPLHFRWNVVGRLLRDIGEK
jgi:hypothetical protein